MFVLIISFILTFNYEKVATVLNILTIYRIKITFAQGEVIDGIQQVGFSNSVQAGKTIDPG